MAKECTHIVYDTKNDEFKSLPNDDGTCSLCGEKIPKETNECLKKIAIYKYTSDMFPWHYEFIDLATKII